MPAMTDWKPSNSAGVLPLENPAKQFQYRHYINWTTVQSWGEGLGRVGKGSWHIQIKDAGGAVIFEQKVTISITVIFAFFALIWYYYDTVGELIETTIVNSEPITDQNPSWQYTIGGTNQSERGNMIPGGDTVPAYGGEGIINAFWESPVYLMDIPVGAKLHVISDNWGLGIQVRPEWQWRFLDGGEGVASLFDPTDGVTYRALSEGGNTVAYSTRMLRYGGIFETLFTLYDQPASYLKLYLIKPSIFCVADIGGLRIFETRDDGQTWIRPADYMANIKVLASAVSDDGGQIFIYGTAAEATLEEWAQGDLLYLILEREGATWKSKKQGKVQPNQGGELPPSDKITGMDYIEGTLLLNTSESAALETWQSTNDMQTFEKTNIS